MDGVADDFGGGAEMKRSSRQLHRPGHTWFLSRIGGNKKARMVGGGR